MLQDLIQLGFQILVEFAPDGRVLERAVWHYPEPTPAFAALARPRWTWPT